MALHPSGPVVFMEPLYQGQDRDPVNVKFFHDARTITGQNAKSHFNKCTSTSNSPSTLRMRLVRLHGPPSSSTVDPNIYGRVRLPLPEEPWFTSVGNDYR
ncbi:hypothetical protein CFC21_018177 [Triticum aestivum]|uniref:Uncharacterized protein n=3 Tax=Triticum TaxID=4564 RepID=A0A9R1P0I2_TRITD|nr:hypothetical protein CFC21_018177 [Triticum aestivum]VAH34603.1 unnamed protein product [Triticum turgidum subsp. durum]